MVRKQGLLKHALPRKGVTFSYHDAHTSHIEGLIARGDRAVAAIIEEAWRAGACLEAYGEQFDYAYWQQAFEQLGFDPCVYTGAHPFDEPLPWQHIDVGVSTDYLRKEAQRAHEEQLTADCTIAACTGCGVCSALDAHVSLQGVRA
jgi:hypothetical protein